MVSSNDVVRAFRERRKVSGGNYFTDGNRLYLFGNMIAEHTDHGTIRVTNAGYPTVTTHKALNKLGVGIRSEKSRLFIRGQPYKNGDFVEIPAKKGFHEIVNRPTHLLVGEAGPERVDVTPIKKTSLIDGHGVKINMPNIKLPKLNL